RAVALPSDYGPPQSRQSERPNHAIGAQAVLVLEPRHPVVSGRPEVPVWGEPIPAARPADDRLDCQYHVGLITLLHRAVILPRSGSPAVASTSVDGSGISLCDTWGNQAYSDRQRGEHRK